MNAFLLTQLKTKFRNIARFAPSARYVLDVGIANRSASEMKCVLPACTYHGVDRERTFDNAEARLIDRFVVADLESDPLRSLAGAQYDLVLINHVLEHIANGEAVIANAIRCLRPGGVLYLEVPNVLSLSYAASRYRYHFHDDPTHKRIYSREELCNAVISAGGRVIECGAANTPLKSLFSLPRALMGLIRGESVGHLFVHHRGAITYLAATRPGVTQSLDAVLAA